MKERYFYKSKIKDGRCHIEIYKRTWKKPIFINGVSDNDSQKMITKAKETVKVLNEYEHNTSFWHKIKSFILCF